MSEESRSKFGQKPTKNFLEEVVLGSKLNSGDWGHVPACLNIGVCTLIDASSR